MGNHVAHAEGSGSVKLEYRHLSLLVTSATFHPTRGSLASCTISAVFRNVCEYMTAVSTSVARHLADQGWSDYCRAAISNYANPTKFTWTVKKPRPGTAFRMAPVCRYVRRQTELSVGCRQGDRDIGPGWRMSAIPKVMTP